MKNPTEIVNAFWTAFAARRLDDALARLTEDCEFVMPGAPPMTGHAQIRPLFEAYLHAFPDFSCDTSHAIESGNTYAAETSFRGTHKGPLRTPGGEVPPTGREVRWQSADIVRVRDGRIASWHVYHDPMPLLVQLGVPLG